MTMQRVLLSSMMVLALVPAWSGAAFADGVSVISGGPKGAAAEVGAAIDSLRAGAMSVCWRGKRSATVRVALKVGRGGAVSSAAHKSGGAVGQCAAGVLAVQRLPGAGYDIVVDIQTASGGAARTAETIDDDLGAHRPTLEACGGKGSGQVALKFLIQSDGRMTDARVVSSSLNDARAEACMVKAIGSRKLRAVPGAKPLYYTLVLALGGGSSASAGGTTGGALTPSKDGPIGADVLSKVMNEARPRFTRCYDNVARKKPSLAGVVWLRFTIRDDGTTRNVAIKESTLKDATVEACLVGVGKSLTFGGEKGRAKTRVFYPLSFSRQ